MTFEQELRTASDSMLRALDQIRDLEEQKRAEVPGTPRFVELARKVETLALEVLRRTEQQEGLARESESLREAGEGVWRPIEAIPPAPAPRTGSHAVGGRAAGTWVAAARVEAAGATAAVRVEAVAPPRDLPSILEEWREAERRLIDSTPGSQGAQEATGDVRRLRDEYARAHAARQKDGRARF
jgi:hypothetical protein